MAPKLTFEEFKHENLRLKTECGPYGKAKMHGFQVNISGVAGGRDDIILPFGKNQSWHAAKPLAFLLNNVRVD